MGLPERVAEIDHVEMPDIGAEDRVEPGAEWVALAERGRVHAVVGLAAEVERGRVWIDPVLLPGDLARREIVELGAISGQVLGIGAGPAVARLQRRGDVVIAVLLDHIHQQLAVELLRLHALQGLRATPLPMLNHIAEKLTAPADAAFEEGEAQFGEAPRYAAEEDRLGDGMAGGREMADMVVDEIRRRVAQPLAACAAVEGRRNAELDAFLPHGVVIVRAVDRQHVIRYREALAFRIVGRSCRDIPLPNMPTFEPSCLVT